VGYHERLGARPMCDATKLLIRNALAHHLLHGGAGESEHGCGCVAGSDVEFHPVLLSGDDDREKDWSASHAERMASLAIVEMS